MATRLELLAAELDAELRQTDELAKKHGYNATLFRQMLRQHGGLGTAQRLLSTEAPQYGLLRLKELGLLKNSLENTVLNPKYDELFLTKEKRTARERLDDFHFEPGGWE